MAKRDRDDSVKKSRKKSKQSTELDTPEKVNGTEAIVQEKIVEVVENHKEPNGLPSSASASTSATLLDRQEKKKSKSPKKKSKKSFSPFDLSETAIATTSSSTTEGRGGELLSLSKAVFVKKKVDFVVSLLPGALRNPEESVERSLSQLLLKYTSGLGGILMAFENVKFITSSSSSSGGTGTGQAKGWILNELPYIHFDVSCDALIFRPAVGCELQGVVNECFPSHIGILVFSYFNAMVSADQLHVAGFIFDHDLRNWVKQGSTQTISNKEKIHFLVNKIHECEGTVSLEGSKPSLSLLVENG